MKKPYKIAVVGIPSSGKTTVCKYLKKVLGDESFWVYEYARKHIELFKGINSSRDQEVVGMIQYCDEQEGIKSGKDFVICESPVWISEVYMKQYFPYGSLTYLSDLFEKSVYDIILFCGDTGNYVQDGIRYQNKNELPEIEEKIKEVVAKYHDGKVMYLPSGKKEREDYINKLIEELK